ncbi:hypothetical protein [Methylobacterium aquaticum]|jgi:hypothetical protein|uniref:Uncharacterized protein n=1 Tax=Methylobacterium aquaticum TaxID=270351 RepID=A0A0J6V996_9HYPH|nr:hypothetical protein [Methylobacterium aquaticum]KMO35536.1 hypothetical protein VP06_12165 [Methylobacterium aquaticum]
MTIVWDGVTDGSGLGEADLSLRHRLAGPNGLREAVSAFFAAQEGVWELRAQLLTDRAAMPVEDASTPWPEELSPYRPVARITVAPQESWSDETMRRLDEGLAFSPWQGLAAHRPLGSVMRARRAVYSRSAGFRAPHNGCPIHEPTRA